MVKEKGILKRKGILEHEKLERVALPVFPYMILMNCSPKLFFVCKTEESGSSDHV